jgi:hypothetical protein
LFETGQVGLFFLCTEEEEKEAEEEPIAVTFSRKSDRSKIRLHGTMTTEEVNHCNSFGCDVFCLQDTAPLYRVQHRRLTFLC